MRNEVEPSAVVSVNGTKMKPDDPVALHHGDILAVGLGHIFSVHHPKDYQRQRW